MLTCIGITAAIVATVDIEKMSEKNQGRVDDPLKQMAAGTPVMIRGDGVPTVDTEEGVEQVPTSTSTIPTFPKTLTLDEPSTSSDRSLATMIGSPRTEYQLVGLGIRTVSFLSIQVYVVGIYVATDDIAVLQSSMIRQVDPIATTLIPSEKERLRQMLLDPVQGELIWNQTLREKGVRSVLRIVPTRNTDFQHLRDGWMRAITARTQRHSARIRAATAPRPGIDRASSTLTSGAKQDERLQKGHDDEFDDEGFTSAVQEFQTIFSNANIGRNKNDKGQPILLVRDRDGALSVWITPLSTSPSSSSTATTTLSSGGSGGTGQSKTIKEYPSVPAIATPATTAAADVISMIKVGHLSDERISRLLWLAYLAGAKVASDDARRNVVDGLMKLVERPVGTAGNGVGTPTILTSID